MGYLLRRAFQTRLEKTALKLISAGKRSGPSRCESLKARLVQLSKSCNLLASF